MKKLVMSSISICVLVIGILAASADQANFGGTWALDKQKSEGLQGPMANADIALTVTQDDKQISIETKYSGGDREIPAQKFSYKLDGSETTTEAAGFMAGKAALKAKWLNDGKALELHSVRKANFQGNEFTITTTERWELAEGGKVLKVQRTSETPRGTRESKLVFNKK